MSTIIKKITSWDKNLFNKVFELSHKTIKIKKFFRFISWTANGPLYPIISIVLILFNSKIGFEILKIGFFGFLIELPIYLVMKNSIKRQRPTVSKEYQQRFYKIDVFSFPSGHTGGAFLVAYILSSFFPNLSFFFFSWSSLVAISRVYTGVHYPTDVFFGAIWGILCGIVTINLFY